VLELLGKVLEIAGERRLALRQGGRQRFQFVGQLRQRRIGGGAGCR
jgi:hypothetical protein